MSRPRHRAGRVRFLRGPMLVIALVTGQAGILAAQAAAPVDSPVPPPADGVHPVIADTPSSGDVPTQPDVAIVEANAPSGAVLNGDPITYTLMVGNDANGAATDVEVTDRLPVGVTFVGATPGCTEAGGLVTCALGDVGSGASLAVTITVTVDEALCGPIANAAHVSASNESGEATGNNDSNDVTNTVECREPTPPDLQVTKSSDAEGTLLEGDEFLYTITVTNVGEEAATGVELVDVLPPGGALNVAIPPFPTFAGEGCSIASSVLPGGVPHTTVQCGPVTLGPGASASVTVKVIVTGDVCGPITNTVDVEGADEPAANVGPDNHAETTDDIACVPRIRLRTGGPTLAHVGDTVTYVFTATNTGGIDLSNIDLTDPMCDAPPTLTDDGNGDAVLAVGEGWTFRCDHTITSGDGDPVHNEGTVGGDHEGGTVSDTDTHDVNVIHPDLGLEETAAPTSGPAGTAIVFTYAVTNTGDTALFDISVDDDTMGHVGDIPSLAAGRTVELTHEVTLGSSPIISVGTAEGADVLGESVSDVDDATVTTEAGGGGADETGGGSPFTGSAAALLTRWMAILAALGSGLLVASRRRPRTRR